MSRIGKSTVPDSQALSTQPVKHAGAMVEKALASHGNAQVAAHRGCPLAQITQ